MWVAHLCSSVCQVMIVTAFRSISTFSATFYRRPLFYKQHSEHHPPPTLFDID